MLLQRRLAKPILFALWGAIGCLIAAVLSEILLTFLLPFPQSQQVDVMFVLDVTGSMSEEISGVHHGIEHFVAELSSRQLDAQVGLIAFGDRAIAEEPEVLSFDGQPFTQDLDHFSQAVTTIQMVDGGDDPESSLDALALAAKQPFRSEATKAIVLITDAIPKIPDQEMANLSATAQVLQAHQISQLHLIIQDSDRSAFASLQNDIPGRIFSLAETATGRQGFDRLLPAVGEQIAVITTGKFSPHQFIPLLKATSLWTGCLAVGIFVALMIAQTSYLRRPVLPLKQAGIGILGSFVAGVGAGAVGQMSFHESLITFVTLQWAGHIVAWSLLGGILGWGMAVFLPNLGARRAVLGGGCGGAIGSAGFLWAANFYGDTAGRLLGAGILGFFIGLMIAIMEIAFREAWLEIQYGAKEVRTVNLGIEPVSIGGDPNRSTIYAHQAPPVAFRFSLQQGSILCEDIQDGGTYKLQPGAQRSIGNLNVTVHAAEQHAATASKSSPHLSDQFCLQIENRAFLLKPGIQVRACDLIGSASSSSSPDHLIAEVNANPHNPEILGLKNASSQNWTATLATGEKKLIEPGRTIRLASATRINFGSVEGEIQS